MKPTATLTNVARGGIVDENALVAARRAGRRCRKRSMSSRGEPQVNPALLTLPNTVLTPHIASATIQDPGTAMAALAVDNLLALVSGRPPLTAPEPRSSRPPDMRVLFAFFAPPAGKAPRPCQHVGQCASQQTVRSSVHFSAVAKPQTHAHGRDRRKHPTADLAGRPGQPHQRRLLGCHPTPCLDSELLAAVSGAVTRPPRPTVRSDLHLVHAQPVW